MSEDECKSLGNRNKKNQTSNTASSTPESASKCNITDIQGSHTTQTTADLTSKLPSDIDTQAIDTAPTDDKNDHPIMLYRQHKATHR